jgi:hypothetical protein
MPLVTRIAAAALLLGVAVAAAIVLNLALLGYAQPRNDPVGKLSPRAVLEPAPAAPAPPPAHSDEGDDD